MDVRVGLWRKLSTDELMLLNCGVGKDCWESLGLQGDPIQAVHPKGDQFWVFIGRTDVEAETPYFCHVLRRVDSLEKTLMLGGIGVIRRRGRQRMRCLDGIMARWTWVWEDSRSWWWTGRPGVLRFMGFQRVGQDWATELNNLECK